MRFFDNFPHLLYFMVIFAEFINILPSKILCMQGKVPRGVIHPSFTPPRMAPKTGLCVGVMREGLVTKTNLRNLEIICTDLLGLPRKV